MITIASIVFDIVLVVIVLVSILIGKHKGFLLTVYMLGIVVIAILLGRVCMPFVATGIETLKWDEKIHEKVTETMMDVVDNNPDVELDDLAEKLRLPSSIVDSIEKSINDVKNSKGTELVEKVSSLVTDAAVKVISYVIVAVIVIIILLLIFLLLKIAKNLPVLGTIDAVGGGILGALTGIAIVVILSCILYAYGLSHNEGLISDISGHSYVIKALDYVGVFKIVIK